MTPLVTGGKSGLQVAVSILLGAGHPADGGVYAAGLRRAGRPDGSARPGAHRSGRTAGDGAASGNPPAVRLRARWLYGDIMRQYGPDSYIGRCAAVMLGCTETTFYTVAVYFGAAGIKRTRYTIPAALTADLAAYLAAAWAVRLFFGT